MPPDPWISSLYIPILFTMLGAGLFAAGKTAEIRDMKPMPWKWVGFLFLAVALINGVQTASCMNDHFYYTYMVQVAAKKYLFTHWGSLLIPFLTIVGLIIWQWKSTRDPFRE